MPMHIAALAFIAFAAQDQPLVQFVQPQTHFIIDVPKTWKSKRTKYSTIFEFPVADNGVNATLEIMGIANSNDKDEWQIGQANAVKDDRRELVRQWQEEILEVPLMMTRSKLMRGDQEFQRDTGMLYADSAYKFVFHLVAPSAAFDQANYKWHEVLQTIRHESGAKQHPFDPTRKAGLRDLVGEITVWKAPQKTPPKKPALGELTVPVSAAGKNFVLRYPKGWTVAPKDDHLVFTRPDVSAPVDVVVQSQVDSAPVARALLAASADSLEKFNIVSSRFEAPIDFTRSAMLSTYIWRVGTTSTGTLETLEGAANIGNEYWILKYSSTTKSGKSIDRIRELMQILRIEAAP